MAGVSEMGVTSFTLSSVKDGEKFKSFKAATTAVDDFRKPIATGGDEVSTQGLYKYHVFTANGTFTVTKGAVS